MQSARVILAQQIVQAICDQAMAKGVEMNIIEHASEPYRVKRVPVVGAR